jgi:hypothetical protein
VPAATGGTIANGTYTLTSATFYTTTSSDCPPAGTTIAYAATVSNNGGTVQSVSQTSGGPINTATNSLTPSGDSLTGVASCGTALTSAKFSATTNSVTIEVTEEDGTLVEVFTQE